MVRRHVRRSSRKGFSVPHAQLRVELLEDRYLLSVVPSPLPDGTLPPPDLRPGALPGISPEKLAELAQLGEEQDDPRAQEVRLGSRLASTDASRTSSSLHLQAASTLV